MPNSSAALRQCSLRTGAKRWPSIASTVSSGSGRASPVTPKVPSCMCRPARPAIWRQFLREERPHAVAVELGEAGEGDVADVEVQPHADRVGGDQIVDVAVLVERHLGVAGAGRQRPHHHRAAALLAPDQFGDRIDIFDRKPDNGRSCAAFGLSFSNPHRSRSENPLAGHELDPRHQRRDRRAHRVRAEQEGLVQPAGVATAAR